MSKIEQEGYTKSTEDGVSQREYRHHKWTIETHKSHILQSRCMHPETCEQDADSKCLFCRFNANLKISSFPDMTFARNLLRIRHDDGFGIEFKAIDALKEVQDRCEEKVHASEEWIKAREQHQESQFFNQNFDWTFTTQYVGTLLPSQSEVTEDLVNKQVAARRVPQIERVQQSNVDDQGIQIQPSSLSIDLNKLKVQEEIMFFDEIDLFEDELADNGVSKLNVRIRVMPEKIYILMRYYLRVDKIKVKVYDTRIYFEEGRNYFERDITRHESDLSKIHPATLGDVRNPDEITKCLKPQHVINQRLVFPAKSN